MKVQNITLEQVLAARERRAELQNNMLAGNAEPGRICLVCLTTNIAGEVKRTPMTRLLFCRGVEEFEALGLEILDRRMIDEPTGSEAFWLVRGDARQVKSQLEAVEDEFPAARLFDFDVLVRTDQPAAITKLSRAVSRRCLICGAPAAECARSRAHGLDAVKSATSRLLQNFCAETLAETAHSALLSELYTTPKPGLVDLANNGAHTDMDVPLFEKSAASLRTYFYDAALLGMNGCTMADLRSRGLEAERAMFEATAGVNTHKGMIYSMGLLTAGAGKVLADAQSSEIPPAELAIRFAAGFALEDADAMMAKSAADPSTNGGRVMKAYGAKGAMWEAATGFPNAVYCSERLAHYLACGFEADVGSLAFCDSMARLEDTNLLHRGGPEGLAFARDAAAEISRLAPGERVPALSQLDAEMIRRNLSPGGSADMLALAFFINSLSILMESL